MSGKYDPNMPNKLAATATAITFCLALAVTGCSGDSDSATTTTAEVATPTVDLATVTFEDQTGKPEVAIDAVDNNFEPQYVEVSPGTKVTFRNDGRNSHNVIPIGSGGFDEIATDDFEPGTEVEVTFGQTATFEEPGDYHYYCTLHGTTNKGMIGAIRVVAA